MYSRLEMKWPKLSLLSDLVRKGEVSLGRGDVISNIDISSFPGPFPIYSSSSKNEGKMGSYGKYAFDEELITWSVDGGGNLFYRPKHKFSVTNVSGYMKLSEKWGYKFVAYCLQLQHRYITFDYQTKAHPSVIKELYFLPELEKLEQKTIASILDTLDTQIRQTEAIIAKLKQVKQGLLHDLLTRGIDENGQLRPPYEQAPELYKESPLGWIPKEWEATELGNALSHIDAGRSPSCPDIPAPSGAWGVLKVSAVHPDGFKEQETKVVEQSVFHNPQLEVKDDDLLITRANTPELVGLPCLVSTERDRLMLSDKTLRLNFKEGQNKAFFFYMLTQSWVRSQIQVAATGTSMSMKNISQLSLKSLKVKQPPTTEQAKISQRVYEAGRQISEETLFLEKIKKQKAGLMDDLLTGRVRVTELIEQQQQAS